VPRRVLDREPTDYSDKWYGWQTLTVDAVAVGLASLAILGSYDDYGELIVPGVMVWMFGSPSVHFAHRNVGMGFASIGLHQAALAPWVLYAACIFDRYEERRIPAACSAELAGAVTVALVAVTMALDAAVFAYESGPVTRARIRRRADQSTSHVVLAPWRDHARDAWGLQLSGAF